MRHYIGDCMGESLTQRAINLLNADFGAINYYSTSQREWTKYDIRITRLINRLKRYGISGN
jgi:hypothetical protein